MMRIESVSQINDMIGAEKLKHPLITLLEPAKVKAIPELKQLIAIDLYSISLKTGQECKIKYGRQNYDFQEGTLVCMAPGQTIEPLSRSETKKLNSTSENKRLDGWTLIFHPDLIISNLELLLNHCKRFFSRQLITRTNVCKDVIIKFEELLKSYFNSDLPKSQGLPSVKYCSGELGYSPNYLSDLLKKETGKNTQEHIHFYLIEKAKTLLLGTQYPVNQIAYSLGFKSPQHFSILFKNIIGISPIEYRN